MSSVSWGQEINFASALLLHSCITVFLKETSNIFAILYRLMIVRKRKDTVDSSIMLDGYTSVVSLDHDGELAELYFTNTGFILLAISLASAIAMNLTLPTKVLVTLIAVVFGLTLIASALVPCRKKSFVMPILSLRRAGRFIWSDTPFVNFFSFVYIAIALRGSSKLTLRDYIIFRCIAILELVLMKVRFAAADAKTQQVLLKRVLESEYVMFGSKRSTVNLDSPKPLKHEHIISFVSSQRLFVMFYKTAIGYATGSLCGIRGPATINIPSHPDTYIDQAEKFGWCTYRVSPSLLILEDCGRVMVEKKMERKPKEERSKLEARYTRFISWTHGVILRQLGRRRVVWLMQVDGKGQGGSWWKGNINLVTGLKKTWLDDRSRFHKVDSRDDAATSLETVR